jgi:dTDP-4-dehydrorhamnose reductase
VHATLDLLIDGASGIWHLANDGATTWAGLARHAAALAGVPTDTLEERPLAAQALPAPRPRYAVLGSRRGQLLPPLDDALARYLRHRALAGEGVPPEGERRRGFRPWRYQQAGGWV